MHLDVVICSFNVRALYKLYIFEKQLIDYLL